MKTDTDDWADFQAALQWRPDPVEVDLLRARKKESGTDIISMLVAIYGSKELFISEYRCLPSVWLAGNQSHVQLSSRLRWTDCSRGLKSVSGHK